MNGKFTLTGKENGIKMVVNVSFGISTKELAVVSLKRGRQFYQRTFLKGIPRNLSDFLAIIPCDTFLVSGSHTRKMDIVKGYLSERH